MKKNDKSKKESAYFRVGEIIFNMTNQNRNLGIMVKTRQEQRIRLYQPEKVTIYDNELSACFSNFMPDKSIWIHI